ncbi:MAG: hypothetical protein GX606_06505 [Elusimicrobia bacterium]|nr:hypothetical protein [Elusimicrobiota bacterium]
MDIVQYVSRHFFRNPMRVAITSFSLLILTGTVLLLLPGSVTTVPLRFVDALFTATSACSVTGLTVVDTGSFFSFQGQLFILLLAQVGGVGIMTFSTLVILMAGRRPGIISGQTLKDGYTQSGERRPIDIIRSVLVFTFLFEAVGAALLFPRFLKDMPFPQALFSSIFHSVAAFCNAGFSLFPDNFIRYQGDWYVNGVLAVLIITGGLGFLVLGDIRRAIRAPQNSWKDMSLQSKLVLSTTALLLAGGGVVFLFLENGGAFSGMPWHRKILAAFFQSVTARTAGFNTIPISQLGDPSLFFLIFLMVIGAGPGSCAGGVKITTMAVLLIFGIGHLRGQERPQVFFRSINKGSIDKAVSLVLLAGTLLLFMTLILLILERADPAVLSSRRSFLEVAFEAASAFGTAGLSTGLTPSLSDAGRLLLTFLMAVGKLGPLTLALAFSYRRARKYHYSEENIMIG